MVQCQLSTLLKVEYDRKTDFFSRRWHCIPSNSVPIPVPGPDLTIRCNSSKNIYLDPNIPLLLMYYCLIPDDSNDVRPTGITILHSWRARNQARTRHDNYKTPISAARRAAEEKFETKWRHLEIPVRAGGGVMRFFWNKTLFHVFFWNSVVWMNLKGEKPIENFSLISSWKNEWTSRLS